MVSAAPLVLTARSNEAVGVRTTKTCRDFVLDGAALAGDDQSVRQHHNQQRKQGIHSWRGSQRLIGI